MRQAREGNHPNIVLILVDDLGQRDLGCYGSAFYETPHLDRLAADGMRFTNAYAACPVCSPSRASLLSGKYPARLGLTDYLVSDARGMLVDAPYVHQLPLQEKSLASTLRDAGYATWHIGKWHLGEAPYFPEHHGFDINIGGCEAGMPPRSYFSPYRIPTLPDGPDGEYLTDRLTQEAVARIEAHDGTRPFFLNLWHYAVHVPIQAPDAGVVEKYRRKAVRMGLDRVQTFAEGDFFPCEHKKDKRIVRRLVQSDPCYAAMVEDMDRSVGRIVDALRRKGCYDETLVVFTSDNGGLATAEGSPTCNLPLSEGKGWMRDGGIRVPLIVKGTGRAGAGAVLDPCATSPDLYPTLLELAGLPPVAHQHVDGRSLVPAMRGEPFERGPVFWHYPHYGNQGGTPSCAVRDGRYKLIHSFEQKRSELFDLAADPSETTDLADALPDLAATLQAALFAWLDDVGARIPKANPAFLPWCEGSGSGKDVPLPFDEDKYDPIPDDYSERWF